MDLMMLAVIQGRLWQAAARVQQRLELWTPGDSKSAADETEACLRSAMYRAAQAEFEQVTRALDLIDEGRYGNCDACGDSLEVGTLLARPYRLVCDRCYTPM